MSKIRVCNALAFKFFFDLKKKGASGVFGWHYNDLIAKLALVHNLTIELNSHGSGRYRDCLKTLQRNDSDVITMFTRYPLEMENITQESIVTSVKSQFLSVYFTKDQHALQNLITSSFSSFPWIFWLFIVLAIISMWLILRFNNEDENYQMKEYKIMKNDKEFKINLPHKVKKGGYFYQVIVHMTRHGTIRNSIGFINKLAFILASFFAILVLNFVSSSIKNQLVIVEEPRILKTYRDLLNYNAYIFYPGGMGYFHPFAYSHNGTIEHELFEFSSNRYGPGTLNQVRVGKDERIVKQNFYRMMNQQAVLILDSITGKGILKSSCSLFYNKWIVEPLFKIKVNTTKRALYLSQDPNSGESMKAFVFSSFFAKSRIYPVIKNALTVCAEHGLLIRIFKKISRTNFAYDILKMTANVSKRPMANKKLISACSRGKIITRGHEIHILTLQNIDSLLIINLIMIIMSGFILIVELVKSKHSHKKIGYSRSYFTIMRRFKLLVQRSEMLYL